MREVVKDVGYSHSSFGFDYETCSVITTIHEQSPDIAQGVGRAYEVRTDVNDDDALDSQGAGDQGMMFGYACSETPELMPLPIMLAHRLTRRLAEVRKADVLPYLRPDGKSQVTVRYEGRRPVEITRVVLATQHAPEADVDTLIKPDLIEHVVEPILPKELYDGGALADLCLVNPTATPGSPAASWSATPTAAPPVTAAARSRARTRARSIARAPTRPATSPRTSWPPVSPRSARCRSPTPSGWPTRSRS